MFLCVSSTLRTKKTIFEYETKCLCECYEATRRKKSKNTSEVHRSLGRAPSHNQLKDAIDKKTNELKKYLLNPLSKNDESHTNSDRHIVSFIDQIRKNKKFQNDTSNSGNSRNNPDARRNSKITVKTYKKPLSKNHFDSQHDTKKFVFHGNKQIDNDNTQSTSGIKNKTFVVSENKNNASGVRIAKKVAECSDLSRRQAEVCILKGQVMVDGRVETNLAYRVSNEKITMGGRCLTEKPMELYAFNKMKKLLITKDLNDEKNRLTLGNILKDINRFDLNPVGRLDYMTEGLLLLTNSGELKRKLELPSSKIKRCYRVRVYGELDMEKLESLKNGITINKISYGPMIVTVDSKQRRKMNSQKKDLRADVTEKRENLLNKWLNVTIFEGKNREIKRIFGHFNLKISRLVRVTYGPYKLDRLPLGVFKSLPIKSCISKLIKKPSV